MSNKNQKHQNAVEDVPVVESAALLSPRDIILRAIGRCEALELEAKNRRTMWGSNDNQGDSTWHFNYGQEGAYRLMVDHLKDALPLG